MFRRAPLLVTFAAAVVGAAACTGSGATPAPATVAPVPATSAPGTAAPGTAAPSTAAGGATVNAQAVGAAGTILVDAASGMTLYNFTKDTKDSGKSACGTGGCIETWPPLTVPAGGTPTGGDGVTGTLATITRDDGTLQVTYNGLPLYFFKNDKAPGDLNGVYDNWVTVKP